MKYILTILLFFQFANCEAQIRKHPARPVSYSAGVSVTYQNLYTWSEDMTNADWSIGTNLSVTANQGNDLDGNNTMNEINCTFSGSGNTAGQTITVIPGDSIYISFDVYLPASGAMTDVTFQFYDLTHFVNIANPSYFSSINTTVQRVTFNTVVPSGCTQLICRPVGDGTSTGKILIGRCQIYKVWNYAYIKTTTTPYL